MAEDAVEVGEGVGNVEFRIQGLGVGFRACRKVYLRLPGKWEFKLTWRKAGLLNSSRLLSGCGPEGS